AYYPYASGKTLGSSISVDVSGAQTASSQADIDLLWAKANNNGSGYTKATPNVALSFDHKLAKFVMNCTVESNTGIVAGDFSTAAVVINGMKTQTTLKLSDGAVGTASDPEAIIPNKLSTESGFLASYDAIIVPAVYSAGDIKVVFTLNGEAYTWTLGAESFAGAAEYIYTVTLTRTGVKATGTINPWTTVTRDPGTAE
ncbi:MAG: fimbrillin family protein, partial [Tannerellaceae bacterium]|nr:fimbrillin family protein [Tannerellaceae bacterium]